MTTEVIVSAVGNKAVSVQVFDGVRAVRSEIVRPTNHGGSEIKILIHSDQRVEVQEIGDFL